MIQFVLGKWLMISPIYTCFFQESLIELCAVKLLKKKTRKLVSQMLHGAGTFTNICPCPKSPSFVGF